MNSIKSISHIIFLFCIIIFFAPVKTLGQLNDNSAEILDNVAKKTKSFKTIKITFLFKHEKNKSVQKSVKGNVLVKGDKYVYSFENQVIYCDGKTTWTYSAETNEVTINNATNDAEEDNINPAYFLNDYKIKFKPKLIRESLTNGKTIQIIDLTPLKARSYSRIRVEIDKAKQQIIQLTVIDKGGDMFNYVITSFTTNQPIKDTEFVFDTSKYKNIEIIDMR